MTEPGAALSRVTLSFSPLDVLYFGDGRPFGPASRLTGRLPTPQVLAGAVRTWLLSRCEVDFAILGRALREGASFAEATAEQGAEAARVGRLRIRGPWFVRDGERLTPMPATVQRSTGETAPSRTDASKGELCRLDPLPKPIPGWRPPAPGMLPLWRRSRETARPRGGYLRPADLARFLRGDVPNEEDIVDTAQLFDREARVGIAVDPRLGTAEQGLIYQIGTLRLRRGVTLAVDVVGAASDLAACPDREDILALGGEGRRAVVRRLTGVRPVPAIDSGTGRGRLLLLTTPALFDGWRPPGVRPIAAAVPDPFPVSGWDLARGGPKATRLAVPAGSVYFLSAGAFVDQGCGKSLCRGEDEAAGWGAFVEGEWDHA